MAWMIFWIAVAGAIGGVVNAFISENGFLLPKSQPTSTGLTIVRPGSLGNMLVGAAAAVISWGLYGPLADRVVIGAAKAADRAGLGDEGVTMAALAGAALIGVGGARWLTDQVDKKLLKAAAVDAAKGNASAAAANQIAQASPSQSLEIASAIAR